MKVIVSHDVDHLTWSEHYFRDLYIPKLWFRSVKLALQGVISFKTAFSRMNFWSDNRMNRLAELMTFEKSKNICATYFFVMRPGLGVAYTHQEAIPIIKEVLKNGQHAGVHGMAYEDEGLMKEEFDNFRKITGIENFGVRMHYLRNDEGTLKRLAHTGYRFDSTLYGNASPYKVGTMLEFPISVMDVYCVRPTHKTLEEAKKYTMKELNQAEKSGQPYFVINFHDMLFHPAYSLYKEWFEWVIDLCIQRGHNFTSFENEVNAWK